MGRLVNLLSLGFICASVAAHGALPRRVATQGAFEKLQTAGVKVQSLKKGSALQLAGVRKDDVLLKVGNIRLITSQDWSDASESWVADHPTEIQFRQDGVVRTVSVSFSPLPPEAFRGITVEYGQITSDYGIAQRTLVSYPEASSGRLPAVFVVQGLSCSSVEILPGSRSNFIRTLKALVTESEQLVMRVEKPGKGDSLGRCSETDFVTELNGYEIALKTLLAREDVDPNRVIVYGSSMGSALAPYLAEKYQLNGVISDGTFYRSWFEHMLEIERRIKTMQGNSQATVNTLMNEVYIPFYFGMLIQKKRYQDLVTDNPLLASHNYHGPNHMYGRPMAFYHQLQDFNVAGAWQALTVPVRVRWGTHDWIMSEYDIDMIAEVLASKGHEDYLIYKYPQMDHWYTLHGSPDESFHGGAGEWDQHIATQIVDWARELNRQPWRQ